MSLSKNLIDHGSENMYASVVCVDDQGVYEGTIVKESAHGLWFSVGNNPDRVILFPWTSVNRVVLKKIAEQ
jgi:hypothetical protein